jgi:hypothetical protein
LSSHRLNAMALLTEAQALAVVQDYERGLTQAEIAAHQGVSQGTVSNILRGICYSSVTGREALPRTPRTPLRRLTSRKRTSRSL